METYWNREKVDPLKGIGVDWGMTENEYVNANIAVNQIYYDMYNNGGGNLSDEYCKYLEELLEYIKEADIGNVLGNINIDDDVDDIFEIISQTYNNQYVNLEYFTEDIKNKLSDKDLSFPVYTTYFSAGRKKQSRTDKKLSRNITFGLKSEQERWEKR